MRDKKMRTVPVLKRRVVHALTTTLLRLQLYSTVLTLDVTKKKVA